MKGIEKLQKLIDQSQRVVFFGGAGVSTESGIPDFRSVDGLYNQQFNYPAETILSHSFFMRHTEDFYRFYQTKMMYSNIEPNAAHKKLAELEAAGKLAAVITQNIDGLHQLAGSKNVLELHGSMLRNRCMSCGKAYGINAMRGPGVPHCDCSGVIKPDVVLYEEALDTDTVERAVSELQSADLVIVGGTSLAVYPAAGLLNYVRGKIVLINRDATRLDDAAELVLCAPIGEVFSQIQVGTSPR
ncbi:MAG: NAD-dependent protein deacylase [Negativicutes bacterium]|nr:NAD-dependent protein deacylase [Negativicutes bacterium]